MFLESRIPLLHLSRYLSLGVPGYFQGARILPQFDAEAASTNKKPWLALVLFDGAIVSPMNDITLADRADHLLSRPELPYTPYSCVGKRRTPFISASAEPWKRPGVIGCQIKINEQEIRAVGRLECFIRASAAPRDSLCASDCSGRGRGGGYDRYGAPRAAFAARLTRIRARITIDLWASVSSFIAGRALNAPRNQDTAL